ncbi:MAG: MMPL family transporter, partial [Pseudomonadales bacterium]|nr:MMPL family transporter [Pseudomonadales bacterium]
ADSLVLEGDEDLEFYREVGKRYASEEFLLVAYQPKAALLSDETLALLQKLADDLAQINGVASVMSILDVPLLYSPKASLSSIADTVRTLKTAGIDRQLVALELRDSPIYKELLSSQDGNTTALQVNIERDEKYITLLKNRETLRMQQRQGVLTAAEEGELVNAEKLFKDYSSIAAERHQQLVADARAVLERHRLGAATIYLGGVPMIASDMVEFVQSDLRTFGLGVLLFMVLLLAIIFKAVRWIILPVTSCVLTIVFMLGFLGWVDWRMTVVSSNFVAILLIIALAISIHLVVRFREYQVLLPLSEPKQLTLMTVASMVRPCVYTALTTIVAFGSLVISGIRPIIDFGWMMTIGVLVALVLTFIVVPVGMSIGGLPKPDTKGGRTDDAGHGVFTLKFAHITQKHGVLVLWVSAVFAVFAVLGIMRLEVENRFIDYFDENTEIFKGMELIDSELGGTIPLDIMLFPSARDTESSSDSTVLVSENFEDEFDEFGEDEFGEDEFSADASSSGAGTNQWFTRQGMNTVQTIHDYLDGLPETGKVISLATFYQIMSDLGGNVDDIQLALAYSSLSDIIKSSMVDPYLNAEADEARISVRVKETSSGLRRNDFLKDLDRYMQQDLGYSADQYRFTGMLVLYNNMLQSLFKSQILTLGFVFIAITAMLMLLFRSLNLAMIAVAPNALAALLVLGGMGWVGLPLDMMTITIAAISIGIGVDDTIHYVHRFKKEFATDRNYINAMHRCHGSIGRAMYYTSVTIIFGFSILALSNFKPSIYFGLLTGFAMFSALMGALMLLPRLLIVFKPLGPEKE